MKKSPVALGIVWGYTAAVLAVLMCGCSERQEETSPDTVRKEAASLVQIIAKHGQGEFARRVREESRGVPPEQCVGMLLAILTDPAYAAPLRSPDAIPAEHPFDLRHNRSRMLGFCIRQLYALAFLDYVRNQRSGQTRHPQELEDWLAALVQQRVLPEELLYDPLLYSACRKEMLKRGQSVQALAEEEGILYPELLATPENYKRLTAGFIQHLKALQPVFRT